MKTVMRQTRLKKKKRRKFFIDEIEEMEMLSVFGLKSKRMNFYQIRVYQEEFTGFFDWYHTQGTVCVTESGSISRMSKIARDAEELNDIINNYLWYKI